MSTPLTKEVTKTLVQYQREDKSLAPYWEKPEPRNIKKRLFRGDKRQRKIKEFI